MDRHRLRSTAHLGYRAPGKGTVGGTSGPTFWLQLAIKFARTCIKLWGLVADSPCNSASRLPHVPCLRQWEHRSTTRELRHSLASDHSMCSAAVRPGDCFALWRWSTMVPGTAVRPGDCLAPRRFTTFVSGAISLNILTGGLTLFFPSPSPLSVILWPVEAVPEVMGPRALITPVTAHGTSRRQACHKWNEACVSIFLAAQVFVAFQDGPLLSGSIGGLAQRGRLRDSCSPRPNSW